MYDSQLYEKREYILHFFPALFSQQNIRAIYHTRVLKSKVENSRRCCATAATVRYRYNAIISVIVVTETRRSIGKIEEKRTEEKYRAEHGRPGPLANLAVMRSELMAARHPIALK